MCSSTRYHTLLHDKLVGFYTYEEKWLILFFSSLTLPLRFAFQFSSSSSSFCFLIRILKQLSKRTKARYFRHTISLSFPEENRTSSSQTGSWLLFWNHLHFQKSAPLLSLLCLRSSPPSSPPPCCFIFNQLTTTKHISDLHHNSPRPHLCASRRVLKQLVALKGAICTSSKRLHL